jgi:hypothetical protein
MQRALLQPGDYITERAFDFAKKKHAYEATIPNPHGYTRWGSAR